MSRPGEVTEVQTNSAPMLPWAEGMLLLTADVAGEHHEIVHPRGVHGIQQPGAFGGVAVPGVPVDGRAEELQRREEHLLHEHLPGGRALAQALAEPGELHRAQQAAARIVGGAEILQVAALDARVEHEKVHQPAEGQLAVHAAGQQARRIADRHPLEPGLEGGRTARGPGPLAGVVVLRAVAPGVVGELVVVVDGHEGILLVHGPQVAVELVPGVPQPVVRQGDDLVVRIVVSARQALETVAPALVLVDVVAHVEDGVEVIAAGQVRVSVEVARLVVGAAHQGEAQAVHRRAGCRGRARAPDQRTAAQVLELVVVPGIGRQARDVHLDGEVPARVGDEGARGHHARHARIGGHAPVDRQRRRIVGGHAGPDDHRVVQRIAGGHAVEEGKQRDVGRGALRETEGVAAFGRRPVRGGGGRGGRLRAERQGQGQQRAGQQT
jgi:hypothetical protein